MALEDAGVAEVKAHPVGGVGAVGWPAEAERGKGGFVLAVPVERVVVAAVAEVQKGADEDEELAGFLELGGGWKAGDFGEAGEPGAGVCVAEASRALLDVGFKMEERVAETGVTGADDLEQAADDAFAVALDELGDSFFKELGGDGGVTVEGAGVKQGQGELDVFGLEAAALGEGAGHGRDAQAGIPEFLVEQAQRLLDGGFGDAGVEQEEQVDVGGGKELAAAETSDGKDGDSGAEAGVGGDGRPEFADELVNGCGAGADGKGAGGGLLQVCVEGEAQGLRLLGVVRIGRSSGLIAHAELPPWAVSAGGGELGRAVKRKANTGILASPE